MTTFIINLVNRALDDIGEVNIATSQFDSGGESHHKKAQSAVEDILFQMYQKRGNYKLKQTFEITTAASQSQYSLGFDSDLLASTNLRFVSTASTDPDYPMAYLGEDEALEKYIDFDNLTLEARPYEWWFQTQATAGVIKVRFNPIPDAIYRVQGFRYLDFTSLGTITALTQTAFSTQGDKVVEKYVSYQIANSPQYNTASVDEQRAKFEDAWSEWLVEDFKENEINSRVIPYQHESERGR